MHNSIKRNTKFFSLRLAIFPFSSVYFIYPYIYINKYPHTHARAYAHTRTNPPLPFPILPLRFNLTITFAIGVLSISRALRLKLHTLRTIYHSLTCVMFQTAAPRGYSSRLLLCWSAAETTEAPFFLFFFLSFFLFFFFIIKAAPSSFQRVHSDTIEKANEFFSTLCSLPTRSSSAPTQITFALGLTG